MSEETKANLADQCLEKSLEFEQNGAYQKAVEQAQLALQLADEQHEADRSMHARARLAWLFSLMGKYEEALSQADLVLEKTQTTPDAVDAFVVKGVSLAETNRIDLAEGMLQRAADISRFIQYKLGLRRALHNLAASVYVNRGRFSLALAAMEEAQQVTIEGAERHWGLPYLRGIIYQITGDRVRLRQALDELVPRFRPGSQGAGGYYYLWSRLALDEDDLPQAEEYLHLAIRIATQTGVPTLQVWTRIAYSNLFRRKGEPSTALGWAENALQHAQRIGSFHLLGQAQIEMAQVLWMQGDLVGAKTNLLDSITNLEKSRSEYELTVANFFLACLSFEQDDPETEKLWIASARRMIYGGYFFILERERSRAYPMVAHFLRSKTPDARGAADQLLNSLERLTPPPIRVIGLGQFTVWVGNRQVPDSAWNRRKSGELFRYLLLRKGFTASREEVIEDFWGDYDLETAQDLLHQATSTIRRVLEPDLPEKFPSRYLKVEGDRVFLQLPPGSFLDFDVFEPQLRAAIQADKLPALQRVLAMYLGDLFPMDQYSGWSARRRTFLIEAYTLGLLALCHMLMREGAYTQVEQTVRLILDQDPWSEDAVFLGMQAFVRIGNKPRAIRLYKELENRLNEDLDLSPKPELAAYLQSIRSGEAL